jgi:hypothetical protein
LVIKTLEQLQQFTADDATQSFKEATRSSSFNLSFGIHECRILANQLDAFRYNTTRTGDKLWTRNYTAAELAALHRLMSKGLVIVQNGRPELSEQGRLVRQLMILSGHIVIQEDSSQIDPLDIVEIIKNGMQWYRDGSSWVKGCRVQTVDGERQLVLTTVSSSLRRDDRATIDQPTIDWQISPKEVRKLG